MPRKRKAKLKRKQSFQSRRPKRFTNSLSIEEKQVIESLHKAGLPLPIKQIAQSISPTSDNLNNLLSALIQKNIIIKLKNRNFSLLKKLPLFKGVLESNPAGFGFIHSIEQNNSAPTPTRDPYVSKYDMGKAQHGDDVLILITRTAKNGRAEATIISVLKRNKTSIAGIISINDKGEHLVLPEDQRFPFAVQVNVPKEMKVSHGDGVIVKVDASETPDKLRTGKVVEVLGAPDSVECQLRFVVEKHNLPHQFSDLTIKELDFLKDFSDSDENRVDLRDIPHITIDGETAKDFDDAVAVIKQDDGWRLYVSIADVSHYVEVGSALDRDAYERGTSVYFPGTVIPMLPEKLSNNLCSLVPNEDRLTVTAILDFTNQGKLKKKSFCRSTINSKYRFTYNKVWQLLEEGTSQDESELAFLPMLKDAEALAILLKKNRGKRGALGFTLPETIISLKDKNEIATISRVTTNFAHKIIEEFMLSANEAVAELFTEQHIPALYRIHEQPDEEKIKEFNTYTHNLGIKLPPPDGSAKWFANVIDSSKDSPKEYVINNLLLRSMKQAKYSVTNVGHFGLAATDYTHFTSPIRRYPDLMVHRELCKLIDGSARVKKNRSAAKSGDFLSKRERTAIKAGRELDDRLKCIFMEKHIGESFEAIISGVTDSALYFELVDIPVSCTASITDLTDDIYLFEYRSHTLIAQNSGIHYHLGETMTVTISRIDRVRNKIIVTPLPNNN